MGFKVAAEISKYIYLYLHVTIRISMNCELRPTSHATEMLIERGISKGEVLETILKGAKKARGKKVTTMFRKIKLVYRKIPCHYIVITAYREVDR